MVLVEPNPQPFFPEAQPPVSSDPYLGRVPQIVKDRLHNAPFLIRPLLNFSDTEINRIAQIMTAVSELRSTQRNIAEDFNLPIISDYLDYHSNSINRDTALENSTIGDYLNSENYINMNYEDNAPIADNIKTVRFVINGRNGLANDTCTITRNLAVAGGRVPSIEYVEHDISGRLITSELSRTNKFYKTYLFEIFTALLSSIPHMVLKHQYKEGALALTGQTNAGLDFEAVLLHNACYLLNTDTQIINFFRICQIMKLELAEKYVATKFSGNSLDFTVKLLGIINALVGSTSTQQLNNSSRVFNTNTRERNVNSSSKELNAKESVANSKAVQQNTGKQERSRETVENDLKYLFGLGLTEDSQNETLNNTLAEWKKLTGENYVYRRGGRRNRSNKRRSPHKIIRYSRKH